MQLRASFQSVLCKRKSVLSLVDSTQLNEESREEPGQAAIAYWSRPLLLVWGLQFESQAHNFDFGLRVYGNYGEENLPVSLS